MDVMKEDVKLVSVSEEGAEGEGETEAADWPWPPLKETARRRSSSPFTPHPSPTAKTREMGPVVHRVHE